MKIHDHRINVIVTTFIILLMTIISVVNPSIISSSSSDPKDNLSYNNINDDNDHHYNSTNTTHSPDHQDTTHHGIHVASWRFTYVREPLIIALFIMIAGFVKILYHHADFLSSWLPESCLLIVLGIIAGLIIRFAAIDTMNMNLTPKVFMLYLLPPIVLDSAYSLNDRFFYQNLGTILIYAVIGTLINWITIGPCLYGLAKSGAMGAINLSFTECLLFSSFIVAVDPVAVLAIFQEIGVNKCLYFLVFGESLFNDAVTVVLSNSMNAFVHMKEIKGKDIGLGITSFFTVSIGGIVIGLLYGLLTAFVTKFTQHVRVVEPLCLFTLAYLSYLSAELFHWSGIISCITCGLVQNNYAMDNLSDKSRVTVKYFLKMLSSTMDTVIFLLLGIGLCGADHYWQTGFIMWTILLCTVFRAFSVFLLTLLLNRVREVKINYEEQFIMFYGGLRGAVCFAIASTLTDGQTKQLFMTATFTVILFTVFVQGITIKPLVGFCKIRKLHDDKNVGLLEELTTNVCDTIVAGVEGITDDLGNSLLWLYFKYYNDKYIKKFLQVEHCENHSKLMEIFDKRTMIDSKSGLLHYSSSLPINLSGVAETQTEVPLEPTREKLLAPIAMRKKPIIENKRDKFQRALSMDTRKSDADNDVYKLHRLLKRQSVEQMFYDKNLTKEKEGENKTNNILSTNQQIQTWLRHRRLNRLGRNSDAMRKNFKNAVDDGGVEMDYFKRPASARIDFTVKVNEENENETDIFNDTVKL